VLTILFDGIAYGMLLFVLACGLAVTLGLMNFVNLAHGAFAMAGGYVTAVLMNHFGVPFLLTLPLAFIVPALIGLVLERTLYKRLYARNHLDQVLFSIGLVFMAVAAVDYAMGSQQQLIQLPGWLQGRVNLLGIQVGLYRSFIIVVCGVLVVALQLILTKTRFGSRLRAAVDDPRVARGLGINVSVIFAATFAVGSGLAGLGGALGAAGALLPERDTLRIGGTFDVVRPGLAQFRVLEAQLGAVPLPSSILPRVLRRGGGTGGQGVAADGVGIPIPRYIGDVRVSRGRITLYKATP